MTLDAVVLEAEHPHDPAVVDWLSGVVKIFAKVLYIVPLDSKYPRAQHFQNVWCMNLRFLSRASLVLSGLHSAEGGDSNG